MWFGVDVGGVVWGAGGSFRGMAGRGREGWVEGGAVAVLTLEDQVKEGGWGLGAWPIFKVWATLDTAGLHTRMRKGFSWSKGIPLERRKSMVVWKAWW